MSGAVGLDIEAGHSYIIFYIRITIIEYNLILYFTAADT